MGNALRDQLLKAGLADKKKAKQVAKDQRKQKKQVKAGQATKDDSLQQEIAARRAADKERSRELNAEREQLRLEKEKLAQVENMLRQLKIASAGDVAYRFTHGSQIRDVLVSEQQKRQLEKGQLAVALLDERLLLIPSPVAEKIASRDESFIACWHKDAQLPADSAQADGEPEEEDPYADYQIPDDLMW